MSVGAGLSEGKAEEGKAVGHPCGIGPAEELYVVTSSGKSVGAGPSLGTAEFGK